MQHISRSLQAFVVIRSGEMDKNSDIEYVTIHTPFLAKSLRKVWCYFLHSCACKTLQTLIAMGEGTVKGRRDSVLLFHTPSRAKVLKIVC